MSHPDDVDLLRAEIDTQWRRDARGRVCAPHPLVLGVAADGVVAAIGSNVPELLAAELTEAAAESRPAPGPEPNPRQEPEPARTPAPGQGPEPGREPDSGRESEPGRAPAVVGRCCRILRRHGPVRVDGGPSYLVPSGIQRPDDRNIVCAGDTDISALWAANPGNWAADEWRDLLGDRLGPWAMAVHGGRVVSICHTPVWTGHGAEAGTWTHAEFRGRGHAAAVTAAWASLLAPTGRLLFYSTTDTNRSSQRVAERLALQPIGRLWKFSYGQ